MFIWYPLFSRAVNIIQKIMYIILKRFYHVCEHRRPWSASMFLHSDQELHYFLVLKNTCVQKAKAVIRLCWCTAWSLFLNLFSSGSRIVWLTEWLGLPAMGHEYRVRMQLEAELAYDWMALHWTKSFIITLPLSPYDLNYNVCWKGLKPLTHHHLGPVVQN